jgi:hypothetical protein
MNEAIRRLRSEARQLTRGRGITYPENCLLGVYERA